MPLITLNKARLSKYVFSLRSDFHRVLYDGSKLLLVTGTFQSIATFQVEKFYLCESLKFLRI